MWKELYGWVTAPPAHRAVFLSGARQVGKTTLLLQAIEALLREGVPPGNILYATFDHPVMKLGGVEAVLEAWRRREARREGPEYLFLDEAQFIPDWAVWVKHQVDFFKQRRLVFTGSATPLLESGEESGVGRWHTIRLTTLSFYEYLRLRGIELPKLMDIRSLTALFEEPEDRFLLLREQARAYVPHFHEYLMRGGFPQTVKVESITQAQRLLREDIVDKILKRDMTALFGVRRVLELERTFLYLCMHDGGLLDMNSLSRSLAVSRNTVQNFISLLESCHLVYRLPPFGYGKEVLRARYKIYLADAAIAPAVMLKGKSMLDDPEALGTATETAVFKHLYTRYYAQQVRFSYWRGRQNHEVDLVAELGDGLIPFEVKYRGTHTGAKELKGLLELAADRRVERAYVITKACDDFGRLPGNDAAGAKVMRVPAPVFCYWLGAGESREA